MGWRWHGCPKGDEVAFSKEDLHVDKKSNGQGCVILGEGASQPGERMGVPLVWWRWGSPAVYPVAWDNVDRKCGSTTEEGMPPLPQIPAYVWSKSQGMFGCYCTSAGYTSNRDAGTIRNEHLKLEIRFDASKKHRENRLKAGVREAEFAPSRRGSESTPERHKCSEREIICINPCIRKSRQKRHSRVRGISTRDGWLSPTSSQWANCTSKYQY